jgi:hypothetical protein
MELLSIVSNKPSLPSIKILPETFFIINISGVAINTFYGGVFLI